MTLIDRETQQNELQRALVIIRNVFPPLGNWMDRVREGECKRRREIIEKDIAPALLGAAPKWSMPMGYQLVRGAGFNSGSFCIYWGRDPDTRQTVALVHLRKELTQDGRFKFGAVGGYTHRPEQSYDGVLREAVEEVCDAECNPIFNPDSLKYVLIREGKDFQSKDPSVQYTAFAYELSSGDIKAIKAHVEKCKDEKYLKRIIDATKGETIGVELMPLEDIVKLHPADFTYHQQYFTYVEVANRLGIGTEKKTVPSSPVGYTMGDIFSGHQSRLVLDREQQRIAGRYGMI